jgi:hypothetical protein
LHGEPADQAALVDVGADQHPHLRPLGDPMQATGEP